MAVEEEMDVVVGVVDETEGRHTARLQPQIALHALGRGKRQLAARRQALRHKRLLEPVLQVVDVQVVVAMETHQIVLVALVVAEEEVLAMHASVIVPPPLGFLDGLSFGVVVALEGNLMSPQIVQDCFLSRHDCNVF